MATGDKVIFPLVNQRVDKKDLDAMQTLVQETIGRTIAALLGEGSGALTEIPFTWDSVTDVVTFGPFMAAYSYPKDSTVNVNVLDGGVVIHDPTRPGQNGNSTVLLAGIGSPGYLWFKREDTAADSDNRAHWPGPGTGEQIVATNTRQREYLRFAATSSIADATYNNASGWWRFANFEKPVISGETVLVIYPVSALGDARTAPSNYAVQLMGTAASSFSGVAVSRPWGINRLAQDVIASIIQIKDSDVTFDPITRDVTANPSATLWREQPTLGLRQASSAISELQSGVEGLTSDYESLSILTENLRSSIVNTPQVLGFIDLNITYVGSQATGSLSVRYGGGTALGATAFNAELVSDPLDYIRKIKITVLPSGVIEHISGQPFMSLKSSSPDDFSITSSTEPRSFVSGKIGYPKTASSIVPADGREGSITPGDPDYVAAFGQFVITAKVVKQDDSDDALNLYEPFTLTVYGRNLALGA